MQKIIRVISPEDIRILNVELENGYEIRNAYSVNNENGTAIGSDYLIEKKDN